MKLRTLLGVLVLCAPLECFAEQYGAWKIATLETDGRVDACHMQADYNHGVRLGVVVFKNYKWGLSLYHDKWTMSDGQIVEMAAFVDGSLIATGKAEALNAKVAVLPLEKAVAYRALQSGHVLELTTPSGKLPFSLKGTSRAMEMVLNCVANIQTPSNGVAVSPTQPSASEDDEPSISRAEATVMLTNMLNAAGVTGYRLSPPTKDKSSIDFVLNDGANGTFTVVRNSPLNGADELTSTILDGAANFCKGSFKSGKQPITTTDGSVVRKVIAECATDGVSVVAETTIVRRSDGMLYYVMHSYNPGNNALKAENGSLENHSLMDAAVRFGPVN